VRTKCTNCRDYFPKGSEWWSNSVQRICSEECFNEYTETRRRKGRERVSKKTYSSSGGKIPPVLRHYIHDRDRYCRMCGDAGYEVHHVTFRSQGGKHEQSNLILLCTVCHHTKAHGAEARRYAQLFRAYIWLAEVEGKAMPWPVVVRRHGWMVEPDLPVEELRHFGSMTRIA
jgi:5-methylcytosine-specific restriction endonuclease McrA